MPAEIELLAQLQIVDQRLREKRREMEESEGRLATLQEAQARQTAAAGEQRAALTELTAKQKDLEFRMAGNEARVKDRRMRITRIRNDKELQMTKRELEILREEATELETELLAVMEQVDSSTARLKGVEDELEQLNAAMASEADDLRARVATLKEELATGAVEREAKVAAVPEELRRRYEMIFQRRGGLALVEIRGGVCQGCRMRVPPQLANIILRNEQVNLCPNCQRMLFWRPEPEEATS